MVTGVMLAYMRKMVAQQLSSSCVIERRIQGANSYGYTTPSWRQVETSACRILPENRQSGEQIGEAEQGRAYFRLILPYDADVADGDRVIIDGAVYEVQQIEDVHTDRVDRRVRAVRLGDGE